MKDFILSKKFIGPIIIIVLAIIAYKIIGYLISRATIKGKSKLDQKRRNTIIILFF